MAFSFIKYKYLIAFVSICIIIYCAYINTYLKEGLTNENTIILLGDSVLNNAVYVPPDQSVEAYLKQKTNNLFNYAQDGATILDVYGQLEKISKQFNKSTSYVFISVGGIDILNKSQPLTEEQITLLFKQYMDLIKAIRQKLPSINISILNLYLPSDPRYEIYKSTIEKWNMLINQSSNKIGEMYNVIDLFSILDNANDFINEIEPSSIASQKIANVIYLST
jgi:hypothetical protein